MIALSRSYVRMEYELSSPDELDALAEDAYEISEKAASEYIEVHPVGVEVRVEEGSIDIFVIIETYAPALFLAISAYGGFWDGLSRIMKHARIAGKFVSKQILKRSKAKGTSRVTTGPLTQFDRLFHKVESRELTADEATERSLRIFVKAGEEIPEQLKDRMMKEFAQIRVASSEEGVLVEGTSEGPPTLIEPRARISRKKAAPKRRVPKRGVVIRRLPEEHAKKKRHYS